MRYLTLIVLAALSASTSMACSPTPPPGATTKAVAAATVSGGKPESDIATITLSPEAEKRLGIVSTAVARQSVPLTRTVGGEAIIPPGQMVVVTAPVAGALTAPSSGRATVIGPIKSGAALFNLLPLQVSERDPLAAAQRESSEAEAKLTLADQRLRRLEALLKEGSVSAKAVEEARAEHTIAAAAAAAAKQRLATAGRLPMGSREELALTSPLDGEIIALRAAAGQTVQAGAPVAEVARLDTLWVRVPLFAGDVTSLDLTKPARIAALGRESTGPWRDARRVDGPPSADLAASSIDAFFALSNADGRIRPHERLSVQLALAGASSTVALMIPESAIVRDPQGGTWVYEVKGPHAFARRRVELGDPSSAGVVVLRGLTEGTRIVITGVAELYGTEFYVSK